MDTYSTLSHTHTHIHTHTPHPHTYTHLGIRIWTARKNLQRDSEWNGVPSFKKTSTQRPCSKKLHVRTIVSECEVQLTFEGGGIKNLIIPDNLSDPLDKLLGVPV